MLSRRKEIIFATVIYFVTMFTLLTAVYRFLETWKSNDLNFFVAGALVLLAALGWGYVLSALIFAPKKQMEDTLTSLTNDIIHELNIPLSTIKANTAMLKKTMVDEKSLKRIKRIEDASVRLKKLYDELVYSIHKEMHIIEKERFNMQALLEERIDIFKEQKRNPFELILEPYEIEVDKIGFEQMFDNLISNAMKYSSKESPIRVTLNNDILSVEDEGVGMETTELLRVHERYYQADDNKDGKGLGLALVKAYCDEEGLEIRIKSEKGVGTNVSLKLSKVHV
ncbi:HAMP domain-containing sensor histidine kinase [Sulfurovum sp.]|uniref:sensor histidine kinase n=1 Tax=Sulfurovum sp. TaxID=1969726 RepID=UPI002867B1AC|nr:HAMP domain-containing sensor histidine kinase [Sulfurovum sp.]